LRVGGQAHGECSVLAGRLDQNLAAVGLGDFADHEQPEAQADVVARAFGSAVQGLEHWRQRRHRDRAVGESAEYGRGEMQAIRAHASGGASYGGLLLRGLSHHDPEHGRLG